MIGERVNAFLSALMDQADALSTLDEAGACVPERAKARPAIQICCGSRPEGREIRERVR